jgi:predicted transposase YdaD
MPDEAIHHLKDNLLKATFSNPDNARALFQNQRPSEPVHTVDWNCLVLEFSTFSAPPRRCPASGRRE